MKENKTNKKNAWAIRINNRTHLVVIPWSSFKQQNTPFRYCGKWWRRSNKKDGWAVGIETKITSKYFKIADIETGYHNKSMFNNDMIATFPELLSDNERRQKVADIILK